jgi:hypothetical protein
MTMLFFKVPFFRVSALMKVLRSEILSGIEISNY